MTSIKEQNTSNRTQKDAPPVFKSWFNWYSIVLAILFVELILFYIIAKVF